MTNDSFSKIIDSAVAKAGASGRISCEIHNVRESQLFSTIVCDGLDYGHRLSSITLTFILIVNNESKYMETISFNHYISTSELIAKKAQGDHALSAYLFMLAECAARAILAAETAAGEYMTEVLKGETSIVE